MKCHQIIKVEQALLYFLTLITETRTFQNTPLSSTELSLFFLSPWISGYILFRTTDTENSADERPRLPS